MRIINLTRVLNLKSRMRRDARIRNENRKHELIKQALVVSFGISPEEGAATARRFGLANAAERIRLAISSGRIVTVARG